MNYLVVIGVILVLLLSFASGLDRKPLLRQQIFYNGTVLSFHDDQIIQNEASSDKTLDPFSVRASGTAMVVRGDRIAYVGSDEEALSQSLWHGEKIDLQGKIILPGIVDAHSHFLSTGLLAATINLNPPPAGPIDSLESLYESLSHAAKSTKSNEWIIGLNYDNTLFKDGLHPDLDSLDRISDQHPIFVRHHSGHLGVVNTKAFNLLVDSSALNPETMSMLGSYADGRANGLLSERMLPSMSRFVDTFSKLDYLKMLRHANALYLSNGITTIQDGGVGQRESRLLEILTRTGLIPMRTVAWLSHKKLAGYAVDTKVLARDRASENFLMDTIKITTDGSPQGYTAFLSAPYFKAPPSRTSTTNTSNLTGYRGSPLFTDEVLRSLLQVYHDAGFRLAIHANGDAAIEQVINTIESLDTSLEIQKLVGPRFILVHAQTIRKDQLDRLAGLNIQPSLFPAHTHYWGDWHRQRTLGIGRANAISPIRTAAELGLRPTIHSDAPVTSIDPMHLIWSATERTTRSGIILGPTERISRARALRALTLDAAWQAGVQKDRGSLEPGKAADFIIVSDNPLTIPDVRAVRVLETIVGGLLTGRPRYWLK